MARFEKMGTSVGYSCAFLCVIICRYLDDHPSKQVVLSMIDVLIFLHLFIIIGSMGIVCISVDQADSSSVL